MGEEIMAEFTFIVVFFLSEVDVLNLSDGRPWMVF